MLRLRSLVTSFSLIFYINSGAIAGSKVIDDGVITLPSLANPMPYSLYLPDGYCKGELSYPVLYLLHGYGGSHKDWLKAGRVGQALDHLISSGRISPMIVVMPSAHKS